MKHEVAAPGVKKRAVLGAIKKPPPPASKGGEGTSDPSLDFGLPSSYASSNVRFFIVYVSLLTFCRR